MKLTWWQWSLAGLGVIVLAVLLVYAIGAALPVAHTASLSARIEAPQDSLWALITDVRRFPEWRPDVRSVEVVSDEPGPLSWRETTGMGALTFVVDQWDPPRRLVARIADQGIPFGGSWTYVLEPAGDGTSLTITEDGEVYNPLFRFMSRFIFGHEGTLRAYLEAVEGYFNEE